MSKQRFDSFNWLRGVSDDQRIRVIHRLVLMRICLDRFEDSGRCNPGYQTVADELGVDRSTIFRAIDVGMQAGWLAQTIRHGRTAGDFVFTFPITDAGPGGSKVAGQRPQETSKVAAGRPQKSSKVAGLQRQGRRANQQATDPEGEISTNGRLNGASEGGPTDSPSEAGREREKSR